MQRSRGVRNCNFRANRLFQIIQSGNSLSWIGSAKHIVAGYKNISSGIHHKFACGSVDAAIYLNQCFRTLLQDKFFGFPNLVYGIDDELLATVSRINRHNAHHIEVGNHFR